MDASQFVHVVEARQGYKIGCVERSPGAQAGLTTINSCSLGDALAKSGYGAYIHAQLERGKPRWRSPLSIAGARHHPRASSRTGGVFPESFRGDKLAEQLGHRPDIVQTNVSVSARGTVRGIHFADVPPSQAKYITCLSGALVDYIIDIRVGSPTFGQWESVLLDTVDRRAVYLPEGMGHAFCAVEDDTTAMYLVTATYNPTGEHGIHPLDRRSDSPPRGHRTLLSEKDSKAPSLAEALDTGLLPTWEQCQSYAAELASR